MSKRRALIALALLLLWAPDLGTQQGPLRIHFVDVGQGDGILIQTPSGQNVVYDAGESRDRMRDYLTSEGVSAVSLAIASHNHADHIGGLADVIGLFPPPYFMDNGVAATTQTYARLLGAVAAAGSQLLEPTQRSILLGDVTLHVVPPPGIAAWEHNDNSIGIVIEYGTFRLSLTGDAEPREWAHWLTHSRDLLTEVQVHKSSHHGSINGDTGDGITRLSPEVVVISAGEGNSYGHPDPQALRLYADKGATVYRTDLNGAVIIEAQSTGAYTIRVERGEGAQPPPGVPAPSPAPSPTPAPAPTPTPAPSPSPSPSPSPAPTPSPTPPSSWSGSLPSPTVVNGRPTCSASLFPAVASCVNNIVGSPTAVCKNGRYSCSANASGSCSGNTGVHCWKCPGPLCGS